MSELGQQLKEARLQKGLSLDDVQEMTKIRKRYLEAIETGDYKVLPGSFYVRAFIKTYAETVGLNPDEILEGHQSNVPEPEPEAVMEPVTQKRSSRPATIGNLKWLPTALMWLFLVLIVGVIYAYWVSNNHSTPKTAENTTPITTPSTTPSTSTPDTTTTQPNNGQTTAPNGAGGQTPDAGQTGQTQPDGTGSTGATTPDTGQQPDTTTPQQGVTVAQDGKQGKTTIFKVSSATGATAKVDIKATGESWLEVYKGQNSRGEKLSYGMTKSGDAMSFDIGPEGLYIKSGRSSATDISVAGQPITDNKSTTRVLIQQGEASTTGTSAGVTGSPADSSTGSSTDSTQSGTDSTTTDGE
ncbi:RodZ family helix-turn-helix domain-containing protein [Paenibacillus jamilae]|uniref:helix-turn-helix domain-containing protein n=1 Tax=Paenibacillus TaxID=44249 RepID=UPI00077C1156|nr:RodZ family helix-turn-helix domain-containing protein [Paenibacillus polymyxa]KYG95564.1 XRE family transcriptional regulator [Paenibacillus polymyxa]MCF2718673.1 helix-turn-helix domain-containing protein [Paenibacillus sp. UKAQ_18]